jgi:hypothetical protein
MKKSLRLNLYHDWDGMVDDKYEYCPKCGVPNRRAVIIMIVDEIYRKLSWFSKLFIWKK